jgi:dephospho-CoA kinase
VPPRRLLRVGLTGGIASGKSHVLRRLEAAGFATVDLDRVAHALLAKGGAAFAPVVEAFGSSILDPAGAIDRKALGAIVFAAPEARARLDALVHPRIREEEAAIARAAESAGARVLVTDAALLVETGLHLRFDRLVVTWCPAGVQLQRLRARDGIDEAAARARLGAQMPGDEKRAYGHFVIDTSGTPGDTDTRVDALAEALRGLEPPPPSPLPPARVKACLQEGPAAGPRGLTPARVVSDAEQAGGLDLSRLARLLEPPVAGPWYRAARPGEGAPFPDTLAGALAVVCAARGADAPYVLGAAASLARLTHLPPRAIAGACVAALAAWEAARTRTLPSSAVESWVEQARAWAGVEPPEEVIGELLRAAANAAAPGGLSGALAALLTVQ